MSKSPTRLHANIHKLVISQALSKLGDNFTEVALALFVLAITHNDAAKLGIVLAMVFVPRIALGWAVAGIIDRLNRRRMLWIADVVRAILVMSIPLVQSYAWTIIAVFLMYSFAMVYQPTVRAIQPQVAQSPEINAKSMARQQTYYAVADIGAYLLAALIIFLWGVTPAFGVDAATYLGATLLILSMRVDGRVWEAAHQGASSFFAQIQEGYRYLRQSAIVTQLVLVSAGVALAGGAVNTMLPPLSKDVWHASPDHYVWLVLGIAVGSLISGTVIERWDLTNRIAPGWILAVGFFLPALSIILLLEVSNWWAGALALVLAGMGNAVYGTGLMLRIQAAVPSSVRARVLALRGIGLGVGGAIGAIASGALINLIGAEAAIPIVSALWLLLALWVATSRGLREHSVQGSVA